MNNNNNMNYNWVVGGGGGVMPMKKLNKVEKHLKNTMKYENVKEVKHIVSKCLTISDVNKDQARLSIPNNQVLSQFLTHSEDLYLKWKTAKGKNNKFDVRFVVGNNEYKPFISRWNYHDNTTTTDNNNNNLIIQSNNINKKRKRITTNNSNNTTENNKKKNQGRFRYVVKGTQWNELKVENNLKCGDLIHIVSFRSHHSHDVGFVLLRSPPSAAASISASSAPTSAAASASASASTSA